MNRNAMLSAWVLLAATLLATSAQAHSDVLAHQGFAAALTHYGTEGHHLWSYALAGLAGGVVLGMVRGARNWRLGGWATGGALAGALVVVIGIA